MRAIYIVVAFLLVVALGAGTAYAANLQVSIADASGTKGSTAAVPVTIAGGTNVGSMDLVVTYDPAVLTATDVSAGALNKGMALGNMSVPGIVAISLADSAGMSGDGPVATITFSVIGNASQTSPLAVQSAKAYDATTFLDIPLAAAGGTFTVTSGTPSGTPAGGTPKPSGDGSMILLAGGSIVAAAYLVMRKKE